MIYEAVLISRNADGGRHIVPMGYREQGDEVLLAPFRPSRTLDNLERTGQAVLNLTDNVAIIAGCLTGRTVWPVLPARDVAGERLADALAHRELEVTSVEPDEQRPRFVCRVRHAENHRPFKGFNRAQAAVIEAAILVTRLDRLSIAKIDSEVDYLRIAIEKTAGPQEQLAWAWLMERIAASRAGHSQ
ncbi:MAG: DUF447 domain-containing protein [Gammaproteobacteria bacterium]